MNNEAATVCAVIVTYNRKNYLCNLLNELCKQTHKLSAIFVLNNHSTDDTAQALLDMNFIDQIDEAYVHSKDWSGLQAFYYCNEFNSGGSGGFRKVFELVSQFSFDYIWAMDDDVLPAYDCLELLLKNMSKSVRVVVPSRTDDNYLDSATVRYNLSNPFLYTPAKRTKRIESTKLRQNSTKICTFPFEGPLFQKKVIDEIGYPDDSYFILYDDSDYARRCLDVTEIHYIKDAILHRCIVSKAPEKWSWKSYYGYRNCFRFDRQYGKNILVKKLRPYIIRNVACLLNYLRQDNTKLNTIKIAYYDAVNNISGKTVEPGKLDEYLISSTSKLK